MDAGADNEFATNFSLQNLLILTAIKADKSRVADYIQRLNNFDNVEIAQICVGAELYEEAFSVYKKADMHSEAMAVLLDYIGDLERAQEVANKLNEKPVYSLLAKAYLQKDNVDGCIKAFIAADDADCYREVIHLANSQAAHERLIEYLKMARDKVDDPVVDTEIAYSYAATNQVAALEEFVSAPNTARIEEVGDRCFDEKQYNAAKLLYKAIDNYSRLASCLIKLEDYSGAADAAKQAGSVKTYKEVCIAVKNFCIDKKMFDE